MKAIEITGEVYIIPDKLVKELDNAYELFLGHDSIEFLKNSPEHKEYVKRLDDLNAITNEIENKYKATTIYRSYNY